MRMVDIDDFIEDQLSVIDASVVNLLQGWGYTEGERLADGILESIYDSLRQVSEEMPESFAQARSNLVLSVAVFIAEFGLPMDDAERALIEAADSYIGELESGGPYGKLEKLFGQALTAWRAEQ